MSMRWLARFLAGGVAVAADPPKRTAVKPVVSPVALAQDRWIDRLARCGGNIAILAGLALIPVVAAAGFASDPELHLGSQVAQVIGDILQRTALAHGRG